MDGQTIFAAFTKWINQCPGLEPGNYISDWRDREGRKAYNAEVRSITAQRKRALAALADAQRYPFNPEAMTEALRSGFSGRLQWVDVELFACNCLDCPQCGPHLVCAACKQCTRHDNHLPDCKGCPEGHIKKPGYFDYTTGQYWPTEYRIAAAVVLERYAEEVRPKHKPGGRLPQTISELKEMSRQAGGHFFSRENMRFFRSRILPTVYVGTGGVYFVTSEEPPHGPRRFTVRCFDPQDGDIDTVGSHCAMGQAEAQGLARRMANETEPLCRLCIGSGKDEHNPERDCWMCHGTGKARVKEAA